MFVGSDGYTKRLRESNRGKRGGYSRYIKIPRMNARVYRTVLGGVFLKARGDINRLKRK
jgi:hypothetical protein